jgi:hypothetical protein
MTRSYLAAAAVVMACLQAGPLFADDKAAADTATTPAPTASPSPSVAPTSTSTEKTGTDKSASGPAAKPKKIRIQMSTQTRQELDHSIKTRTVPSRYRSQVPKEYQKYIPFER